MIKNWLSAIGLGAGMWAAMFIGVSAIMVLPIPLLLQMILEIILAGVVAFILAKIYFKKNPGDIKAGLILAVLWFVIGGVLDLLITIQYAKGSATYIEGLKMFYGSWSLWVGFLLMFVGVIAAVKLTHGGDLMKRPPPVSPPVQTPQEPQPPQQPPVNPPTQTPQQPPASPSIETPPTDTPQV